MMMNNRESMLAGNVLKGYLYVINYPFIEKGLCQLEMKCLFHKEIEEKYFFSEKKINPSRSPYIKHRVSVMYCADSLEELMGKLQNNKVAYNDFKFVYFKIEDSELGYDEWISSVGELGRSIDGSVDMVNPKIMLGATKVHGQWIFGELEKNDNHWQERNKKPNSNSHSLKTRAAKALVNIAVGDELNCTLIDPCCGVGTVVIEAISMQINVKGYEINSLIARKAEENLAFFGYENVITNGDMHEIKEHFDVAIVDIPYGLFTPITLEKQCDIIKTARRIADKLVIITFEDMDKALISEGFAIVDHCHVIKGNFIRTISICH
jgi:predicted RNA methylase